MENLVEIKNLTFWYENTGDSPVLEDINLTFRQGEFVALVGPNGCGKSTLIRHLNGLLKPSKGKVLVGGFDTSRESSLPQIRRMVGMVFQNPDTQLFAATVEEDVAFGPENLCLTSREINDRVTKALEQVGMLDYRRHPPHRLSGGQKQKVAIAGILAMEPRCIVLDEPTSMLDPGGKREVMQAVIDLNRGQNITIIHVTHDMAETLFAHRLIALSGGRVCYSGSPGEFFANSELLQETGIRMPPIKELVYRLRDEGIKVPDDIISVEELVDALCSSN